jgi:hypothetical protein
MSHEEEMLAELNMLSRLGWHLPGPSDRCLCCGARVSPKRQKALARLYTPKRYGTADRKVATDGGIVYIRGLLPTGDHAVWRN